MLPTGSRANRDQRSSHSISTSNLSEKYHQSDQQISSKRAIIHNQSACKQSRNNRVDSSISQTRVSPMNGSQVNVRIHSLSPMPDELIDTGSSLEQPKRIVSTGLIIREILQVVIPALVLALVIHLFLAQATIVYGRSMEPNLSESQRLIIDKLTYRFRTPERNEIVVLNIPTMDEMLVKRIVGLPGERVAIRNGIVYINSIEHEESFQHNLSDYDMPEMTLGPLSYFVLGDNRTNSNDSRVFGSVKRETIVGRVWIRYWPVHELRFFE